MRLDLETTLTAPQLFQNDTFDDLEAAPSADALLKRGVAAAQSGDRDHARKLLTQVIAYEPGSEDAWMWLASISDYPEELLAFLDRVLAINPENVRAVEWRAATISLMAKTFVRRAVAAHAEGNNQLAEQCIEQALANDQNCVDAWAWKASVSEDEDDQLELLHRVLEIDPDHIEATEGIRQIEERREETRRLEEARRLEEERLAAEAARLEEERRLEQERLAAEAARLEEERRREEARRAEELRVAALFSDAKAAAMAGDNAGAVEMIDEYLEHRTDDVAAFVFRSHVASSVEEKLASLEKALSIDPDNAAAKSAYDFLSSMAAPAAMPAEDAIEAVNPEEEDTSEVLEAPAQEFSFSPSPVDPFADRVESFDSAAEDSVYDADDDLYRPKLESMPTEHHLSSGDNSYDPYATVDLSPEGSAADPIDLAITEAAADDSPFDVAPEVHETDPSSCPFCGLSMSSHAFECDRCQAILTFSDLEAVLSNMAVDRDAVSRAVIRMEADVNTPDPSVHELTWLSVGHLNLGSYEAGLKYLQQAASLDPNNVVLAGQVNALAIRLDEIDRQREVDEARPKGKTILVVDDSATVRKLISGKLEKSGHVVVCASDGVEALERISEQLPDLVLLDITMPRMDGYEVCKQIRANPAASHIPVVMISGKDGFFDKVRGRMAGTTGYVTKPFGPEALMRALELYLLPDPPVHVVEPEYEPELEAVV